MLTTTRPVHQRAMSHSRHFLAPSTAPWRASAPGPVHRCTHARKTLKKSQLVAISRAPITPCRLPNRSHMSLRRSEIGSDQRISDQPRSLVRLPPAFVARRIPTVVHLPESPKHHGQSITERRGNQQSPRGRRTRRGAVAPYPPWCAALPINSASMAHSSIFPVATRVASCHNAHQIQDLHTRITKRVTSWQMRSSVLSSNPREFATRASLVTSLMLPGPCRKVSQRVANFGPNGVGVSAHHPQPGCSCLLIAETIRRNASRLGQLIAKLGYLQNVKRPARGKGIASDSNDV